jgi:hypothetical protein
MLTPEQDRAFAADGAVTIDTPFTSSEIQSAAAAMDRLLLREKPQGGPEPGHRIQRTSDFFDLALLDLIQHPFLESTAKSALRAVSVDFFATAIVKTYPEPGKPFSFWEHVDIKYRTADLDGRPRNMICSCLLWLTDVSLDSAPLMFRPGSHRLIAAEMDRNLAYIDNPEPFAKLPKLPYAEPQPLLAKAGQLTVCTTATVHGASVNTGTHDRKVIFITFVPKGYVIRANMAIMDKMRAYQTELRRRLRPERLHILPEASERPASAHAL